MAMVLGVTSAPSGTSWGLWAPSRPPVHSGRRAPGTTGLPPAHRGHIPNGNTLSIKFVPNGNDSKKMGSKTTTPISAAMTRDDGMQPMPLVPTAGATGLSSAAAGGGGGSAFGWLPLAVPIGLSPLLILTLCRPERVLVVSTEPPDDLSCLTTPGGELFQGVFFGRPKLGGGGNLVLLLTNEGKIWYKAPCCCILVDGCRHFLVHAGWSLSNADVETLGS